MDGDKAVERVVGSQSPTEFSEIMYITQADSHTALPLPFFQPKNLRYIDHAATVPTIKSNPREGESKGFFILDVLKLTVLFGAETSIDFDQWHEAAPNCFRFQMSRDNEKLNWDPPRVLVVGPEHSGKTTVCKILTNYAVRAGQNWSPFLVNVDPSEVRCQSLSRLVFSTDCVGREAGLAPCVTSLWTDCYWLTCEPLRLGCNNSPNVIDIY